MPTIYRHPHLIRKDEIDAQGHVNNLQYLKWMQTAAVAHSSAQGWPPERYLKIGTGWVVRSHHIEYLQPAFVDQQVIVVTWVSNFKRIRSLRKYKIVRQADESVLAVASTDWVYIGIDHRAPRQVPPELAAAFQTVGPDEEP